MSIYVVDASVAAKWFFDEIHSNHAKNLLSVDHELHVPDFFFLEIDSIICKKLRMKEINLDEGKEIHWVVGTFPIHVYPSLDLRDTAFELASSLRASPYDSLYLALAILFRGRMVTADERFYKAGAAHNLNDHLCWIQELL